MTAPDFEFVEGFDKYGPTGVSLPSIVYNGEWTSIVQASSATIGAPLTTFGYSLQFTANAGGNAAEIRKTLPGNYAEFIGGVGFNPGAIPGVVPTGTITGCWEIQGFYDNTTQQMAITLEQDGTIGFRRGSYFTGSTLVAKSAQSISSGSSHFIEWDVVIHNSTGVVKVWLDGVLTSLNLTSQNTRSSANNYANVIGMAGQPSGTLNGSTTRFDNYYTWGWLATGGGGVPLLTNPVVETGFPTSDSAVQFSPVALVLGQDYSASSSTNAPGANELFLRVFTPLVNCTINSVSILPAATSLTAKFKAVIYATSAGLPTGAPLSSGTEVVGCTSGTVLTGALVTPQALTGGTAYAVGFITDTSILLSEVDATTTGQKAANTYASGAPTSPTMTINQPSWIIFGNCSSAAANYAAVTNSFANPPLGDPSYNQDATVSHEDLFGFPALSSGSVGIATMAVKGYCERSDSGARTVSLRTKSSATDSGGSLTGQSPGTTYEWLSSYFDTDPNGAITWLKAAIDAAASGYKIDS